MLKRRPKLSHLSDFVEACLGPSLAAQGFATSDVIVAWPDIVGERLASFTQPLRSVETPVRRRRSGDAAGTRDARRAGRERLCAGDAAPGAGRDRTGERPLRLALHRAHRPEAGSDETPGSQAPAAPAVSEADRQRVGAAVRPIAEEALKAALGRLGEAVIGSSGRGPRTA